MTMIHKDMKERERKHKGGTMYESTCSVGEREIERGNES